MNLKYYLRGLGLGIVITAIIMGIATSGRKETLTDDEVIARAEELGMVENSVLNDYVEKARIETEEKVRKEAEEEHAKAALANQAAADSADSTPDGGEGADGSGNADALPEEDALEDEEEPEEPVMFTVRKGETPMSISERLEKDGLVAAAAEFDKYLVDNGYDRKIVASEYAIPADADMDIIARIITGHRVETETVQEP